jgi:hypothetical protein
MKTAIEVPADEVRQVFMLLEDLNSFLHDPQKYGDTERVIKFVEGGMYKRLHEAYYQTVWNWLPQGIQEEMLNRPSPFENGH